MLLDATRKFDRPLSLSRLCRWQAALFPTGFSGLHRVRTGKLRGSAPMRVVSGPAGKPKLHFEAPPRLILPAELSRFITWFNSPPAGLDGLLRAGIAHLWFVTLHPFEDGNGRIARALTDMKERSKLYGEMQVIDKEDAPDMKIAHSVVYEVMRKEVTGYKQSPFGAHQFNGVDVK